MRLIDVLRDDLDSCGVTATGPQAGDGGEDQIRLIYRLLLVRLIDGLRVDLDRL